jgi:hypothetical protein
MMTKESDKELAELSAMTDTMTQEFADNLQQWKGMSGDVAFHLIDRHADGWGDVSAMMNAWLRANGGSVPND